MFFSHIQFINYLLLIKSKCQVLIEDKELVIVLEEMEEEITLDQKWISSNKFKYIK